MPGGKKRDQSMRGGGGGGVATATFLGCVEEEINLSTAYPSNFAKRLSGV